MDLNFFGSTEAEVFLGDARLRRRAFKEYKEMACLCIVRADEVREKWEISIAKCGYALVAELLYVVAFLSASTPSSRVLNMSLFGQTNTASGAQQTPNAFSNTTNTQTGSAFGGGGNIFGRE